MTAATEDRNTGHQAGEMVPPMGMAASAKVFAGTMVARNATGYATPAADAANLVVVGMAEEQVDNSSGADGAVNINKIRRGRAFWFTNSGTNAVTAAHIGTDVYVEDDQTVASAGGVNSIVAGKCLGVDASKGVLVYIG